MHVSGGYTREDNRWNHHIEEGLWREYQYHRRNRGWPCFWNAIACQWVSHGYSITFASDATTDSSLTLATTQPLTPISNGTSRRSRIGATASLSGDPQLGTCTAYVISSKIWNRDTLVDENILLRTKAIIGISRTFDYLPIGYTLYPDSVLPHSDSSFQEDAVPLLEHPCV